MILKIDNLVKSFSHKTVLDHISYDFSTPGLYIIKGKSGGGKSTLLNILAGFETQDEGNVIKKDCEISCMFQNFELLNDLTVDENISLNEKIHDCVSEHKKHIIEVLGLGDLLNHYPEELSGGQKQRVGIARALCSNANVFLCDEPTESLDFRNVKKVMGLLTELSKTKVVIVVTHNLSIIDREKHTVLHMENGHLTIEVEHKNKDNEVMVTDQKGYNQQIVQDYTLRILQRKTKSQMIFFNVFMIMTLCLMFLYGKVFVGDKAPHTVTHDIIYVATGGGISLPDDINEEEIIRFSDYNSGTSFYPLKIVPLHHDLSEFEVIGKKILDGESVIINQNTAQFLLKEMGLNSKEDLLHKKIAFQYKIKDRRRTLDMNIEGIVNEEDVGTYSFVYYDKNAFDNRLKAIPFNQEYSDFDIAYRGTNYYEIICDEDKLDLSYDTIKELKGYDLFNIEKTQIEENTEKTMKLKPYYLAIIDVFIIFEYIYMIYNSYKDWNYHLGAFAIMISNGAHLDEMKKLYMQVKMKKLFKIIVLIDVIGILVDLLVFKKNMWIVFNVYIIVFVLLFVLSVKIMSKKLRTETISMILKEDKEMK